MKLVKIYLSLSKKRQITIAVVLFHLLFLICLSIHHLFNSSKKPNAHLSVKTFSHIEKIVPKQPAPISTKTPHKTATEPSPKPQEKPKVISPKKTTSAPSLPKKPIEEVAAKGQKSPSSELKIPAPIAMPMKNDTNSSQLKSYEEENLNEMIISFLQNTLELPEFGEVKAKIEIDSSGHLVSLNILSSKSKKNEQFLKNQLPDLIFPCLNKTNHIFTITFHNAKNN